MPYSMKWCLPAVGGAIVALASLTQPVAAQQAPTNLGFEQRNTSGKPLGWTVFTDGHEMAVDSAAPLAGNFSLRSRYTSKTPWSRLGDSLTSSTTLAYPIALARGRRPS